MRKRQLDAMVDSCASLSARGLEVCAYVIVYAKKSGDVTIARGGNLAAQIGAMEIVRNNLLADITQWERTDA